MRQRRAPLLAQWLVYALEGAMSGVRGLWQPDSTRLSPWRLGGASVLLAGRPCVKGHHGLHGCMPQGTVLVCCKRCKAAPCWRGPRVERSRIGRFARMPRASYRVARLYNAPVSTSEPRSEAAHGSARYCEGTRGGSRVRFGACRASRTLPAPTDVMPCCGWELHAHAALLY